METLKHDELNNFEEGEFWIPEFNEILEGHVKKIKTGKYDKLFLKVEDEKGDYWITRQCRSLDKQIKGLKIKENDLVQIKYNGRLDDEYGSHDYLIKLWED